ncbi:hypothetical protein Bbelb_268410 [Branchiostoma belcheri]|nr:hypothetical protein Bbelb_268410 [Branchiostoma belcheri]
MSPSRLERKDIGKYVAPSRINYGRQGSFPLSGFEENDPRYDIKFAVLRLRDDVFSAGTQYPGLRVGGGTRSKLNSEQQSSDKNPAEAAVFTGEIDRGGVVNTPRGC